MRVMRGPLPAGLGEAAQEEASEASSFFDLTEHRRPIRKTSTFTGAPRMRMMRQPRRGAGPDHASGGCFGHVDQQRCAFREAPLSDRGLPESRDPLRATLRPTMAAQQVVSRLSRDVRFLAK